MRTLCTTAATALALLAPPVLAQDVFPYAYTIDDLDNGLRLITVPTEHQQIVSVYIVVAVGSRHEIEPGRSGFAHFFEHMMFRGSERFSSAEQTEIFKKAGAERNAYTTDDYTCYHATFAAEDLERVLEVEADRFANLSYSEPDFRTEAKAILGEYNTSSANPVAKLYEVMREKAFEAHTYEHTTLGFLEDIERMPEMFDYSLEFFRRHYRPDTTTLLVAGDVDREVTLPLVERLWGSWTSDGAERPVPAAEPAQRGPLSCHVDWPSPTSPWILIAHKGPAFSTSESDMATLDILAALAFSANSELYKKLYVREGVVDVLYSDFGDHVDPYLLTVGARVNDPKDVDYVRQQILATLERSKTERWPADEIERTQASLRYGFAAALDNPDGIAGALAGYIARARTPDAVNRVYRMYTDVTPDAVQRIANEYFVESGRTIATLSHEKLPEPESAARSSDLAVDTLLLPSRSPLVDFRVLFRAGSADDPAGKEGLAYVTARTLAAGATEKQSYEEIVQRLFPMAASIGYQVDKEMTVIHGTVHRDNVGEFSSILGEMLLRPGFAQSDLDRVVSNTVAFLDDGLRRSDEEELGKEVLYREIYAGHPYAHHSAGSIESVKGITVDDVKRFYAAHYTPDRLVLGLAGGFPDSLPQSMARDLARGLPGGNGSRPAEIAAPAALKSNRMTIVQKTMRSTGIHVGFPIDVTRGHPDWVALWLVRSYFGEHRSDNSYLYQRLRETRGLNYGDYAYVEYFPRGPSQFQPDPNLARHSQIFQIWIRPVEPRNGAFTLQATLWELRRLIDEGLSAEAFEATRMFLSKQVHLLVKTGDRRLGYALDSRFYGTPEFADYVRDGLAALTLDDVNRAIREHLRADRLQIVVVTEDAAGLRDQVLAGEAPLPAYSSPPSAEVEAEDREIHALKVGLRPEDIAIVPVEEVFRE